MEGNCPRCQVRLDFPVSGVYRCERCKAQFEVALGSPRPPAPPVAAPSAMFPHPMSQPGVAYGETMPTLHGIESQAVLGVQAPCAGHPENPASQVCERCGDFMCRLCTTVVEGRAYCPKCFDLLYSRGALGFTQRQFTLPGITLTLGIGAFLTSGCFLLGLPLGIAGLITGFRAMKEHRARPDLPKRGVTIAGLWTSGISIVICLFVSIAMIWAMMRTP